MTDGAADVTADVTTDDRGVLTERQLTAARLIAEGRSDKYIARVMGCSQGNVHDLVIRIARRWRLDFSRSLRIQIACHVTRGET